MRIARTPEELPAGRRAVALGTFDGVHRGHRRVLDAARANDGLVSTAVTFWPHPRTALGNRVELLTSLERRLELLAAAGIEDVLVVEFSPEIAGLELAIQRRIAAEEAYFTWLRGNHSLPPAEWAKRRAHAERARSAEDLYVEKLFKSRSARTP